MQSYITNLDHYYWDSVNAKTRFAFLIYFKIDDKKGDSPFKSYLRPVHTSDFKGNFITIFRSFRQYTCDENTCRFRIHFYIPPQKITGRPKDYTYQYSTPMVKSLPISLRCFFLFTRKSIEQLLTREPVQGASAFSTSSAVQKNVYVPHNFLENKILVSSRRMRGHH